MEVRPARRADLGAVVEITNHEIANGFAHFGMEPQSLDEAVADLEQAPWPWRVANDGAVLGFARGTRWKRRRAYARTAEVGVYVAPSARGRGIASALYRSLIPAMREAGAHTLLAGIALPNPASVRLHERFGFVHVGTLPEVGFKLGAWRDVGYWALHL